jgi:hypothetical protein
VEPWDPYHWWGGGGHETLRPIPLGGGGGGHETLNPHSYMTTYDAIMLCNAIHDNILFYTGRNHASCVGQGRSRRRLCSHILSVTYGFITYYIILSDDMYVVIYAGSVYLAWDGAGPYEV